MGHRHFLLGLGLFAIASCSSQATSIPMPVGPTSTPVVSSPMISPPLPETAAAHAPTLTPAALTVTLNPSPVASPTLLPSPSPTAVVNPSPTLPPRRGPPEPTPIRTFTINGFASVAAPADMLTLELNLRANGPDPNDVVRKAARLDSDVDHALGESGVSVIEVKSVLSLWQVYLPILATPAPTPTPVAGVGPWSTPPVLTATYVPGPFQQLPGAPAGAFAAPPSPLSGGPVGPPVPIGWSASTTLVVRLRELDRAGAILDKLRAVGGDNIFLTRAELSLSNFKELKAGARSQALANALKQAQELSGALGLRLRPIGFREQDLLEPTAPAPFAGLSTMAPFVQSFVALSQLTAIPLLRTELTVTAGVTLSFEQE